MLSETQRDKLLAFAHALVNQDRARIIVPGQDSASGFWFGGGNMVRGADGALYVVGRYRNAGDSRTGLAAGARGLELAIFRSDDNGSTFRKAVSWSKSDLDLPGRKVLSIEGSALRVTDKGAELFVSTEKDGIGYPQGLESFLKPGTGVWSIERLAAGDVEGLKGASPQTVLAGSDPRWWHVKDPLVYDRSDGTVVLGFCTHPFSWSSSNSGYTLRSAISDAFAPPVHDFFPRGMTWDVAVTRMTHLLRVPPVGEFAKCDPLVLVFYDGAECMRSHEQHGSGVRRPRGHSCEELGGVAFAPEKDLRRVERLSVIGPAFVSPHGTGCSRYVDVLATDDAFYATWQQSQSDQSQPLVLNVLDRGEAEQILK